MAKEILKPRPRIGVSRYTIFPLTKDDTETGTATYGEAKHVPGTVEIALTDSANTENFDADNIAYETESYVDNMGHDITNADIPPEIENMMRGLDAVDNGVEISQDSFAKEPYFGVAWEILKSNGAVRFVRYYRGKYALASPVGAKTKASSGAPEKQTAQAHFAASYRECDGKLMYYLDSDNLPESCDIAKVRENWYKDLNWYPSKEAV